MLCRFFALNDVIPFALVTVIEVMSLALVTVIDVMSLALTLMLSTLPDDR